MEKWNCKNKAVTFSYDDGVMSDPKLVEIFNRYGLKCTFNLNSGIMTPGNCWDDRGVHIFRMEPDCLPELYKGHEIAVHTRTHCDLTQLSPAEMREEILGDKTALEELFGCEVVGMAYPYGTFNDDVLAVVRECGIRYARTVIDRYDFNLPNDLLTLGATCHHSCGHLWQLVDDFLAYSGDAPAVFNLWGHSYEFEVSGSWELIEEFCRKISGRDDVFYGTNREVYLGTDGGIE
ncbi:MAG: polysaccharide deacetylase family protein [Ruminococcus sp.]|nr:polysaccharide deacetylase family protein [Ruminococcus sp.]